MCCLGDSRESSQAGSHDSSSQHDQAMAAAWARLHSADTDMGASSPGNLAADWRSAAQVPDAASPTYATAADRKRSSAEPAEHPVALSEQAGRASAQPVQSPQPSASAEPTGQRSEVPSPTSPSRTAAQTAQDVGSTPSSAKQKHAVAKNSPLHARSHSASPQPYTRPVTRASAKTPQSATRGMSKVILKSPQPTKLSASKADVAGEAELASSPEHRERPALTPVLASLKKVARQTEKASASSGQFHQQPMTTAGQNPSHEQSMQQNADALDAKAVKMAMQVMHITDIDMTLYMTL